MIKILVDDETYEFEDVFDVVDFLGKGWGVPSAIISTIDRALRGLDDDEVELDIFDDDGF